MIQLNENTIYLRQKYSILQKKYYDLQTKYFKLQEISDTENKKNRYELQLMINKNIALNNKFKNKTN